MIRTKMITNVLGNRPNKGFSLLSMNDKQGRKLCAPKVLLVQ